jgi:hypothetical protein
MNMLLVHHAPSHSFSIIATLKAWEVTYLGNSSQVLRVTINEMNRTRWKKPNMNFVPIVQSSGMGKSKTVDELAKFVFTLPFNLRAADQDGLSCFTCHAVHLHTHTVAGFPTADNKIRDTLHVQLTGSGKETRDHLRCRYLGFLSYLFDAVRQELSAFDKKQTPEELASKWRTYLVSECRRDALYDKVVKNYVSAARMFGLCWFLIFFVKHSSVKATEGEASAAGM